jgi:pectinesterase
MRDQPPYRQRYPMNGGTPTRDDLDRTARYDRTNVFGDRNYFFNSHRAGGDFAWHHDNLGSAPGTVTLEKMSAKWTFAGTWDPERSDAPQITKLEHPSPGQFVLTFSESVTVKGQPRLGFAEGGAAVYLSGSGSHRLVFTMGKAPGTGRPTLDFRDGTILASEAGTLLRIADSTLP